MDPRLVFTKKLTGTDVNRRLSFPTEHLDILPQFGEDNAVAFRVRCGDEIRTFRCVKRNEGPPKPVIEHGWRDVVRRYNVKRGDELQFYREENDDGAARYWIEIYQHEEDAMGTCRTALHTVNQTPTS